MGALVAARRATHMACMTRPVLLLALVLAFPSAALARSPGLPVVVAPGLTPGPSPQQVQSLQLQLNEQQLQLNQLQQQPQTPLQNQNLLNMQQQLFQQQIQLQQLKTQQGTCNALGRC